MTGAITRIALACAVVGAVAGCAATRSHPASGDSVGVKIIMTRPADKAIAGAMIFPTKPGEDSFSLIDDAGRPRERVVITRSATSDHNATLAVAEGDRRIEFIAVDDRGNIALTAVIDHADHALTLFNPPLTIAPSELSQGEPFVSEAAMNVVDVNKPSKQRERGTAKRTITYVDDAIIRVAGAEHLVARIEIHFAADLRLADADEHTTLYISREDGLIASDSAERITVLGAFPRKTHRVLARE